MSTKIEITPSAAVVALSQELAVEPGALLQMILCECTEVRHPGVAEWIRARCRSHVQPGTMLATLEDAARLEQRNALLPEIALARAVRACAKLERLD